MNPPDEPPPSEPPEDDDGASHAHASDRARIYQARRDLYVAERDQHIYYLDGVRAVRRAESGGGPGECPYPGLSSFGPQQAKWFFGRDELISDLLLGLDRRLGAGGALAVIAPSGAGKSSLLKAGLLPAIAHGMLPVGGSGDWPRDVLTPTDHPMAALAARLARLTGSSPDEAADVLTAGPAACVAVVREALGRQTGDGAPRRWIVVVDQLEELFTLCADERERAGFLGILHAIAEAGADGEGPVGLVVYGLRSDFYTPCTDHPQLRAALQDGPVVVGPLTRAGVREAVMFPARDVGLTVDPGLVGVLLRDLGVPAPPETADDPTGTTGSGGYEAGRLPLLAHALRATWQQQHGHTLTLEGYEATGGIARAVSTTAEQRFTRLDPAGRHVARAVLLRLVRIGTGHAEDTRRRVPYADLLALGRDSASAAKVIEEFTRARLLTRQGDSVEITHEVLLREWRSLRQWIEADRADNLVRQELEEAATGWESADRDPGMLYRGSRLETADAWGTDPVHQEELSSIASAFLTASLRQRHRARLRNLRVISVLTVLFLIASSAAFIAYHQRATAQEQRDAAILSRLTAQADALRGNQPSLAAQLDLAAYHLSPTQNIYTHLITDANNPLSTTLTGHSSPVWSAVFSPRGHLLASGSYDGTVRLWSVPDPAHAVPLGPPLVIHSSAVTSVAFSRDGHILAASGADELVRLWDVTDPAHPAPLGAPLNTHTNLVRSVVFSPDGRTLATSGKDGTLRLWDLNDPAHPAQLGPVLKTHAGIVHSLAFSPDGRTLASSGANGTVQQWDVTHLDHATELGKPLTGHTGAVWSVAFSPDGHILASSGEDGTVRLWDLTHPGHVTKLGPPLTGHTGIVYSVAFSPDGHTLASSGDDGTVRLWDLTHPDHATELGSPLVTHDSSVFAVSFSPDGHTLAAGEADSTVRLWNLSTSLGTPLTGHTAPVLSVAFSRNGHILASAGRDQTVRLWNFANPADVTSLGTPLVGHYAQVNGVAFSPDGRTLASASSDQTVRLWDLTHPGHVTKLGPPLTGHVHPVWSVAFSPDGHILASAGDDGTVRLWNVTDPAHASPLGEPLGGHASGMNSVVFSPDSHILAAADLDGTVRLWDVTDPAHPALLGSPLNSGSPSVASVAFSPDGRTLASADSDGTVRLWDLTDPAHATALGSPLNGQAGPVRSVAFSPDGRTLASVSADDVWLWDLNDPTDTTPLTPPLTSHTGPVNAVVFSPDERTLVSAEDSGTVRLWRMSADQAIQQICADTNPLTRQQWQLYLPGEPFTPLCR